MVNLTYLDDYIIIKTNESIKIISNINIHHIIVNDIRITENFKYYFTNHINDITYIAFFINDYHFKNSKLHNLDNKAIHYNKGDVFMYYIHGISYTYDDWLVKSKIIKRKDKLKDILC